MIFFVNTDLTLYIHSIEDKKDKYTRVYIDKANIQKKKYSTLSDKGLIISDSSLIFIEPIDIELKYGDIIVIGSCDLEISSKSELKDYNTLSVKSFISYPTHCEIEGV